MVTPLVLISWMTGDLGRSITDFEDWLELGFLISFLTSCLMGFILMYATVLCTAFNSALTTTIVGCLKVCLKECVWNPTDCEQWLVRRTFWSLTSGCTSAATMSFRGPTSLDSIYQCWEVSSIRIWCSSKRKSPWLKLNPTPVQSFIVSLIELLLLLVLFCYFPNRVIFLSYLMIFWFSWESMQLFTYLLLLPNVCHLFRMKSIFE